MSNSMSEDLVSRLREWIRQYSGKMPDDIVAAADLIESLRQQLSDNQKQVTLLRDALGSAIEFVPTGYGIERKCWEALDATDPNIQQFLSFTDPVTDDDFLHMIDESNFAQERE